MTTYTVPGTIAGDGSVDVGADLNAWMATVPDGSEASPNVIEFGAGAVYNTEPPLYLRDRYNLVLEGNGATFECYTDGTGVTPPAGYYNTGAWPRPRCRWTFFQCDNITARDMVLRGGNPDAGTGDAAYVEDLEAQHGFEVAYCTHVTIEDNQVFDVYGDCVYVSACKFVVVTRNTLHRNGRQGFGIASGSHIRFTHNDVQEIRRAHVDIECNLATDVAQDIRFEDNHFGDNRLLMFANQGSSHQVGNIWILRNRRTGAGGTPLIYSKCDDPGGKRGPWWIEGNDFGDVGGSSAPGFLFRRSHEVHFTDNRAAFPPSRHMTAVRVEECGLVDVARNDFTGNDVDLETVAADPLPAGTALLVDV